jgi:hypothetical protein
MLTEIMLDKARIAQEAAEEWAEASVLFGDLVADPEQEWPDAPAQAVSWIGGRQEKVLGMTESELRRSVKRYLNSWAQGLLRKRKDPEPERGAVLTEWDGMMDDLREAERVALGKSGKKNLTPWRSPRGRVVMEGESVDFTSHEFWSDEYLYGTSSPQREGESRTAFIRRMGDAAANAKARDERMPQPHNGTRRAYSISGAHPDALIARADGAFDPVMQTVMRPTGGNRRPMGLREEDWVRERPVTRGWLGRDGVLERRIQAGKYANEPLQV